MSKTQKRHKSKRKREETSKDDSGEEEEEEERKRGPKKSSGGKKTTQWSRLLACYGRVARLQTAGMVIVAAVAILLVTSYVLLPTLTGLHTVVTLVSGIRQAFVGGGGGNGNTTPGGNGMLLTSHFLSALAEISTTIPRFNELQLAPDRYTQHTMRRRQLDMIEKLAFTSSMIGAATAEAGSQDNNDLARQVLDIKSLMQDIHQKTAEAEDAFKDAIATIDSTTAFILKQLPLLNIYLQQGAICTSLSHLETIIKAISTLILQLDSSTAPVTLLRQDVTRLVSNIGIVEARLQYMQHRTNVGLVAHDRHSEAYRSASWFTTLSRPDQQKYESLVLLHRNVEDMQLATQFLDTTFERSELQITVALNHLRSTNRRLTDIYTEMGRSSVQIETYKLELQEMNSGSESQFSVCEEKIHFGDAQLTQLKELGEQTVRKIEAIRLQNDPILSAISVYGYGAIGASTATAVAADHATV
jgi:hypothetical protein